MYHSLGGERGTRWFSVRNVVGLYTSQTVLLSEIDRIHGVDERISVENLVLGVKIACDVIRELCLV